MPRPKNKSDLLSLSKTNYNKLHSYIDSLSKIEQQQEFPHGTMNRNIRDVICHLHHWHLMMLGWYEVGMAGDKPEMPAKGYTWKTTSLFNKWILQKYQNTSLDQAVVMFDASYQQLRNLIGTHTNDELFEKKRFKWTGTTSLGAYLISATSSHYDWGLKLIKKAVKKSK